MTGILENMQDEMLNIIKTIEKLTEHNQIDHRVFYTTLKSLQKENAELKQRIGELENKLGETREEKGERK